MRRHALFVALCCFFQVTMLMGQMRNTEARALKKDYPVSPVAFTQVKVDDAFWTPRVETNRAVTIPFAIAKCEESGRMWNFARAAVVLRGEKLTDLTPPGFSFDDTDPYKVIEGASYALLVKKDDKLEAKLDEMIAKIAAAQEPDGYLFTPRTMNTQPPHKWIGTERWVNDPHLSHELYNCGHLFEAAAAHYQATGKRNLLDVAMKVVDLLEKDFGDGQRKIWPGHQIVEMGLVKLYRLTGEERCLRLAKFFLEVRGPGGGEYAQAHLKVTEQKTAVGHAVRAGYMYAGMADVAALTGDRAYVAALDAIWENATTKKLYITGGIGARHDGEAFGNDYELPNASAYCETCASIANVYWNHRMFLLHEDAKYIDVMERSLYNAMLSGVSLDGKGFYYPNPLDSKGEHERQPWFGCACCPSNVTRFLASVSGYMYGVQVETVYVNLFAESEAVVKLGETEVTFQQETRYPWEGKVRIAVQMDKPLKMKLKIRVPGWARGEPVAGDLYKHVEGVGKVILTVNSSAVPGGVERGYVTLERIWKPGDAVEITLPMPVQRVLAHEKVEADRGRVAVERGPIVYCVEGADHPDGKVLGMELADHAPLAARWREDLLGGVMVVEGEAMSVETGPDGAENRTPVKMTMVPYAVWSNRGKGEMAVWLRRK